MIQVERMAEIVDGLRVKYGPRCGLGGYVSDPTRQIQVSIPWRGGYLALGWINTVSEEFEPNTNLPPYWHRKVARAIA